MPELPQVDWSFTKIYHHEPTAPIDPSRPELSAKGKIVVVVGASRGIGLAVAESFAVADAADIVITGRSQQTLDKAREKIEKAGKSRVHTYVADIADNSSVDAVFQSVAKDIGPVDIVVSNAGIAAGSPVTDSKLEDFWKVFETNTKGNFNVMQAFSKVATKDAVLIGMNSGVAHYQAGYWGPASAYASSKAAMAKLYEYFQAENPNIRVFSLSPGVIATDMSSAMGVPAEDFPDGKFTPPV